MLERAPDMKVVGEADDGPMALRIVAQLQPDVLLLDMEMPGMPGLEVARQLAAEDHPVRVLALSAYDDEQYIFGLLDIGASGYLTKDEAPTTILDAVRGVAKGEDGWISRRVAEKLVRRRSRRATPADDLSEREREVLRELGLGKNNREIADALFIAEGTVKNHVTHIYEKLGLRTRAEAVAWAWQHGVVRDG